MLELEGYEPGSDLTVMNIFYKYSTKDKKTGKRTKDYATIVFKDNETGIKHCQTIVEPTYTYYLAKPDYQVSDYNRHFIEIEKTDPITCKYNELYKSIAKETGNMDLFKENIKYDNYRANRLFLTNPRVFSADMPILNFMRQEFNDTYKNPVCPIDIVFFDTEADGIKADSDDIEIGRDPTNCIGMYYTKTNTMYSFVLRNPENPQIEALEKDMKSNFQKYYKMFTDFIKFDLGSDEKIEKYGLKNIKLSVGFFDTEAELLVAFFNTLKQLHPDFAMAYNMAYDMPQLIARLQVNGLNPKDVICDKEFDPKFCSYYVDEKNINMLEERCDFADISAYTTYLDQMILYISRRKGQHATDSYSLDTIGGYECRVKKLDYHDITTNIAKFPYLDFKRFWLYNMIDVIVQVCLEAQTGDLKYVFNNVIEMNTPYQKIFRQTVYLAAKGADFYKNHEGVIMGENVNKFGTKPDEKFAGAFVADPLLLSNRNKIKSNGKYINKFNNANDFDYKRLYPSLLQEFNMAPNTQVGKIIIEDSPVHDIPDLKIDSGGTFTENLASYNFIEFCHRWLKMANIEMALEDVNEYFTHYRTPSYQGKGNLPYDSKRKIVAYTVDKTQPVSLTNIPIPEWVDQEVNNYRNTIKLK